jgi:alkaline phosphatase D
MHDNDRPGAPTPGASKAMRQLLLRRRDAYRLVFGAGAALALRPTTAQAIDPGRFRHGVASGDPRRDRVIIWTRVTSGALARVRVAWRMSTTPDMRNIVAEGRTSTTAARDFTVKIDVKDLEAGRTYWYQFSSGGKDSPIGRTRTLPGPGSREPFSLAVFSCTNYEKGFFNVYREAAQHDLAAVLHLGDYIYEYGRGGYGTPALDQGLVSEPRVGQLVPPDEIVLLDAYRERYALYHTDPDLQALRAHAPWITAYDDHESANDSWTGGAENHDPASEGLWQARKEAALQAYYEWLPIRDPNSDLLVDPATGNPTALSRSFTFGSLARLVVLDSRLEGRNQQLTASQMLGLYVTAATTGNFNGDVQANGQPRTLLGADQEAWLDGHLAGSRQVWQLIGSQTLAHYQIAADFQNSPLLTEEQKQQIIATLDEIFAPGVGQFFADAGAAGLPNPETTDSWNGYPSARLRLNASLAKAANPVILSGDSHNAWAANLAVPSGTARLPLGVEFGTASVTSPGFEEVLIGLPPALVSALVTQSSAAKSPGDRIIYADTARRGFIKLEVSEQRLRANFIFVSTVFENSYTTSTTSFEVLPGQKKLSGT